LIDAIGTPAFALIGFQLAYLAGIPLLGALFVGLVNGVAGGIARDLFVGNVPSFFRPGQYFSYILIACLLLYVALVASQRVGSNPAAWIAILFATVTRGLVIRYDWKTRPVSDWTIDETITGLPTYFNRLGRFPGRKASSEPKDSPDSSDKNKHEGNHDQK
jgi:uncharacterized membrane protein YeiH